MGWNIGPSARKKRTGGGLVLGLGVSLKRERERREDGPIQLEPWTGLLC